MINPPDDCSEIDTLPFLVGLIMVDEVEENTKIRIRDCIGKLKLNGKGNLIIKGIKIPIEISDEEILKKVKEHTFKSKNEWFKFYYNDEIFKNESKIKNPYITFPKILDELKSQNDHFISKLLEAYIYLRMHNRGKASEVIIQMLKLDPHKSSFYNLNLNKKQREKVLDRLDTILDLFSHKIKNTNLFETLVLYTTQYLPTNDARRISLRYSINYSLNTIRGKVKSPLYGIRLPGLWFPILYRRSNISEAKKYLLTSNIYENLEKNIIDDFWIFEFYFPKNKQKREVIYDSFIHLEKSQTSYRRDLYFRLLENLEFKQYLTRKDKKFKKPIILAKRKLYKDLLSKGIAVQYSLYKLIQLGDFDMNYILWPYAYTRDL